MFSYLLSCSLLLVVSGMKCSRPKTQSKAPARTILASSESSEMGRWSVSWGQGCQIAKFDPFLSLDCARVEGVGAQSMGSAA